MTASTLPHMLSDEDRAELVTAGKQVRIWTAIRDETIARLVAKGGSLREVGDAVGLSHTAVSLIAARQAKK